MKRKAIEKLVPLQPTSKGKYITTVQKMDNILILNVYKDGELRGRHALDTETGEYCQYIVKDESWKFRRYASLLDIDTTPGGWYSREDEKRAVFDTPEQEKLISEDPQMGKKISWKSNTYEMIEKVEQRYSKEKREKAEKSRRMKVQDKMNLVPALPDDAHEWIWEREGAADYTFFDKNLRQWFCTACKKSYPDKCLKPVVGKKNVRHNDCVVCPRCKKSVIAKKRVSEIEQKTHFSLLQKMDDRMSVARHFDVRMLWNGKGRKIQINEAVRIVLYHTSTLPKYCAEIFYNQYGTGGVYGGPHGWDYEYAYFDNTGNPAQRREYTGYLYPEGIEEALEDTAYVAWGRLFAQMAAAQEKINYNRLMITQNDTKFIGMVEYLFKGRFHKLLRETAENVSWWSQKYCGRLCINGENIEEIFAIHDKQVINRIRDVDGGEKMVMWMRWSMDEGKKIPQDVVEWLSWNDIEQSDVTFIKDKMSLQQIMNYVKRQQSECYKSKTAKQILSQWRDYLDMLKTLGKKTDDEMMYRPRELKRRHDECVEEIRKQQMIIQMKRDAKQRYAEAKRMREKFPGAEENLRAVKSKYEYQGEEYIILVPQKLVEIVQEGQALHHCAGASDRYFDRIMQKETYICFLRKASEPKVPFYTIEVEPGGTIRQHRGMYDEEPDIKKIKPFLREWQKEIKKRMSKEDHEYAKVSAKKRQENIEELKAKNNTRVLQGLMEDFMDAEELEAAI